MFPHETWFIVHVIIWELLLFQVILLLLLLIKLVAGHWVPLYVNIPMKSVQDHENVYEIK